MRQMKGSGREKLKRRDPGGGSKTVSPENVKGCANVGGCYNGEEMRHGRS